MQAALIRDRRFWPLFVTQFLGAFNDNLFKNALVILIAFRAVTVAGIPPAQMVALSAAIFIAPYFLFSATAGQLADKLDKATMIRGTKIAEIGVMAVGAVGFWTGQVPLLLVVLFLMGLQSSVFGPCKYSILPQHLAEDELVTGNALIELGTYLAILLGTMAGGLLIALEGGQYVVAGGVVLTALAGFAASLAIPSAPSRTPDLVISLDPVRPTLELVRLCKKIPSVYRSILGISWFWAFGSAFLSLFPNYTKDVLGADESVATLFLALFSIGIGIGSMLCERLSRERLELGLVPIGSFGMSLFTFDLWLVGQPWAMPEEPMGALALLSTWQGLRIGFDLVMLAISGGFMIVPMYTLVQWRTDPAETSRVIAGNNILNAAFMVASAFVLTAMFAANLSTVQVFLVLALVNAAVAIHIYTVVPEFMLRFVVWMLSYVVYRLQVEGAQKVPVDGPVVLVANHVSFIDWFVLSAAIKRPARFVMHYSFIDLPVMKWLFRQARVIPIASTKEDPQILARSFERIHEELADEQVLVIFPEGRLTKDGEMDGFRPGIERILERDPVPVVPIAINGLWGSYFSYANGAFKKPFGRVRSKVWVTVGDPIPPEQVTAAGLEATVRQMWSARPEK